MRFLHGSLSKRLLGAESVAMFKVWLFLARIGMFYYPGAECMAPRWWPKARVRYDDGDTYNMPIGNAVEHAKATGGTVVMPNVPSDRLAEDKQEG